MNIIHYTEIVLSWLMVVDIYEEPEVVASQPHVTKSESLNKYGCMSLVAICLRKQKYIQLTDTACFIINIHTYMHTYNIY